MWGSKEGYSQEGITPTPGEIRILLTRNAMGAHARLRVGIAF